MAPSSEYNQLVLAYGCEKGEGFYGFGAQYSSFNMKGRVLPMFLSEQGVGRGLKPVTALLDAVSKGAGQFYITERQCSVPPIPLMPLWVVSIFKPVGGVQGGSIKPPFKLIILIFLYNTMEISYLNHNFQAHVL